MLALHAQWLLVDVVPEIIGLGRLDKTLPQGADFLLNSLANISFGSYNPCL